ncbi:MAG: CopG family transcriptional regulator [Deltaproteobacteria bacterium]|jgi:hypothetical protein|nr:CopG family transcriptional regulator [Deltaproteobacteria bacterium]MBT5176957.1 CopG family transcriptional regulator [Candidatus Neomarinimicrobiota bacterium]
MKQVKNMRLNARLDAIHEAQLIKIQEQTHASVSEIVRRALEDYYQTVCAHSVSAKDALYVSGFVGCAVSDPDLSTTYKSQLVNK